MTKKTTKRSLAMSILSLVLCLAMLIGSTYAWFSDEAKTGEVNITAGNLDVDIVKADSETESLDGKDIFKAPEGVSLEDMLWEPGVMLVSEKFKIKNNGSLALQYKLDIKAEKVASDKDLLDVVKYKVVKADAKDLPTGDTATLKQRQDFWNSIGAEGGVEEQSKGTLNEKDQTSDALIVVLFWDPADSTLVYANPAAPTPEEIKANPDNQYNIKGGTELKAKFTLNVFATQTPEETDSFGKNYDNIVLVANEASLKNALENYKEGEIISVENDMTMNGLFFGSGDNYDALKDNENNPKEIVIDFNDHTLTRKADNGCAVFSKGKNVTIKNAEIINEATGTSYPGAAVKAYGGSVTLENCTLKNNAGDQYGSYCVEVMGDATVTMNNCEIDNTKNGCINVYGGCKLVMNGGNIKTTKYYPLYVVKDSKKVDISCTDVNFEAPKAIMYMVGNLAQGDTLSFTKCTFKAPKFEIFNTPLTGATFTGCTFNGGCTQPAIS